MLSPHLRAYYSWSSLAYYSWSAIPVTQEDWRETHARMEGKQHYFKVGN